MTPTPTPTLQNYQSRMVRALDYIDRHLDDDLDLDRVSSVAALSKFHFHRQFAATFGLSLHRYVQLARMKRASYQLVYSDRETVTDIAMDAGYETPDSFARAFRQRIGQSPLSFRKSPDWEPWFAALRPLDHARSKLMPRTFTTDEVKIRNVDTVPVAIMEHRGDPATLRTTIQRFIAWRKANGLHPDKHPTFNIWHSEGEPASPDDYGVDLCVGVGASSEISGDGVRSSEIPGGRCAVLRVVGHTDNLEPAALFLYRDWLPASGEQVRDFPLYCQRLSFFPQVPEHEAVVELFLPLK